MDILTFKRRVEALLEKAGVDNSVPFQGSFLSARIAEIAIEYAEAFSIDCMTAINNAREGRNDANRGA